MPPDSHAIPSALASLCVIIPAHEPASVLPGLIGSLRKAGIGLVLVVNDGSASRSEPVFAEAASTGAIVLRHAVNLGKGRTLRTAFNAILSSHPHITGVVTADADGQHTLEDILRVTRELAHSNRPVLGVRAFDRDVPFRSRLGNTLTRFVFAMATGTRLRDTQSGLRGLPRNLLPALMMLDGERYDFEMNMLAHLCRTGQRPIEVPIATVYLEGNRSSHFNPIWDSMRIYFVLARFVLSSLVAAGLDFILFALAFSVTGSVAVAVAFGRISSLVNFTLNRRFVFRNRAALWLSLAEYYLLALAIALASFGAISILAERWHWNVIAAKLVVDAALSLVSFSVQRTFIFRTTDPA